MVLVLAIVERRNKISYKLKKRLQDSYNMVLVLAIVERWKQTHFEKKMVEWTTVIQPDLSY